MNPTEFDLTEASHIYAVANTPLFLARKLLSDLSIRDLSDGCSGEEIVNALRAALAKEPTNAIEAVRPYAFLTALWFKQEIQYLKQAETFSSKDFPWYVYVAQVLLQTFAPIQSQSIDMPGGLSESVVTLWSDAPTSLIILNNSER